MPGKCLYTNKRLAFANHDSKLYSDSFGPVYKYTLKTFYPTPPLAKHFPILLSYLYIRNDHLYINKIMNHFRPKIHFPKEQKRLSQCNKLN